MGQGEAVQWIRYDGWGMVVPPSEAPATLPAPGAWKLQLGPGHFQEGPLSMFGGAGAVGEFESLRVACAPLVTAAADIPAMAMRGGRWSLLPLLRHLEALKTLAAQVGAWGGKGGIGGCTGVRWQRGVGWGNGSR